MYHRQTVNTCLLVVYIYVYAFFMFHDDTTQTITRALFLMVVVFHLWCGEYFNIFKIINICFLGHVSS